jgi:hypothetical protein
MLLLLVSASLASFFLCGDAMQMSVRGASHSLRRADFVPGEMVGHLDESTVVQNNLGGMGPRTSDEPTIAWNNVGTSNGQVINLVMSNTSAYMPNGDAVDSNGRGKSGTNSFGFLNVKCGTSVGIEFAFFTAAGNPAILEQFYLTFADLDSNNNEESHEYMGVVTEYNKAWTSDDSELRFDPTVPKWSSSVAGTGANNPIHPMALTSDEQKRVVTLQFTNKSRVSAIFGVESNSGATCYDGRNLMFALRSNLAPYTCNTCGISNLGPLSCCADGGSWNGKCGNIEDKAEGIQWYSWKDGVDICAPTKLPTSSPTQSYDCNSATCSIMGDPHITVFDGAQVSLMSSQARLHTMDAEAEAADETSEVFESLSEYGAGEFWLVSSEQVRIQAHYMPDETLAAKNLFVSAVAVGGPFLRNKTVIIGALDGAVTYDGREILPSPQGNNLEKPLAAEFVFLVHATQSSAGDVEVRLPSNVKLLVTREADHVNVVIEMPEQTDGGQDGLCGNFNGLAADDTLGIVAKRFNPKVQPQHSLFSLPAQYSPPP